VNADTEALERYLRANIPLSAAMQLHVLAIDAEGVRLGAPLAPNVNHFGTVFGGSAAALATLSGWSLLHVHLCDLPFPTRIVVQRSSIDYLAPMPGDFEACCATPPEEAWERFHRALERRGRARMALHGELRAEGARAATFHGVYDAVRLPGAEAT
jgi:thioesterase domain-containing protein